MFEFGSIISLNYKVTFYCFIAVVVFVIIFEYCTEVIEYFLHESLYSQMIQIIYKELMLMGLVTFCVILFEATTNAHKYHVYIVGIDFSHVFLFFVTLFFVMHGFYLIIISMITTKEYHKNLSEKTFELIVKLEKVQRSYMKSLLYRFHIYPISSIRHRVEFSLIHSIFTRTYLLPKDFDFPQYLSGCFDRVALKTIKRSIFSWVMLLLVIGGNCVRIGWGLTCNFNDSSSHATTTTTTSSSGRRILFTFTDQNSKHSTDKNACRTADFELFVLCGILLIIYCACINALALMYKSRLAYLFIYFLAYKYIFMFPCW